MKDNQFQKIQALAKCTFLPASPAKRFVRSIANKKEDDELSQNQVAYLTSLFHSYRKQLGKAHTDYCDCQEAQQKRMNAN